MFNFQDSNYEKIEIDMPVNGMNQFISAEALPVNYSYYLENIVTTPLGVGNVRFGTSIIASLPDNESTILKYFNYNNPNGQGRIITYVREFEQDLLAENIQENNQETLTFSSQNKQKYEKDTYIKIEYTLDNVNNILKTFIKDVVVNVNQVTITLGDNFFPLGGVIAINNISYSVGKIYSYDIESNTLSQPLKTGLSTACIPGSVFYDNKLIIYNGVNYNMVYDGNLVTDLYEFVKEVYAINFLRIDNTNFRFSKRNGFIQDKYLNQNLIELAIDGQRTRLTVIAININNDIVTLTTQENIPNFDGQNTIELYYKDYPQPFSYIHASDNRLWALGTGARGIEFRSIDESLKLYYSYGTKYFDSWFNAETKIVPFEDLSRTHGESDNLEAITDYGNNLIVIGRKKTQVWNLGDPLLPPMTQGSFFWMNNIDAGIANGELLIKMPNDIYFISKTGLQSFSSLNVAKQFAAGSINSVDPLIESYLKDAFSSNINYRFSSAFKYEKGGFCGFKIGRNNLLVSLISITPYSWSVFSGDFSESSAFLVTDSFLCLAIKNKLYKYADGMDGSDIKYGDRNGSSIINFVWIPRIINFGKRFANKKLQIITDYPSAFSQNPLNQISVKIKGIIPNNFSIEEKYDLKTRGDTLGSGIPFGSFQFDVPFSFPLKKIKFVAISVLLTLYGYALSGPLKIKKIKLLGIGERND